MTTKYPPKELTVKFFPNLSAAGLSGLIAGASVGLALGLKIAKINPSIISFKGAWTVATHFMAVYALGGLVAGVILGLVLFLFLRKYPPRRLRSLLNLYLPIVFIIALFHYIRQYVLSHFIANPLMPIKGSLWANIGFTVVIIIAALAAIWLAVRILRRVNLKRLVRFIAPAFLLLWILLGVINPSETESAAASFDEYEVQPTGTKVALIGIDGAWWKVIDAMMAEGRLPNLQRLVDRGVRGDLCTLYPTFSAMIWTSVATGKLPREHGINSFLVWSFPITGVKVPMFRLPLLAPELIWIQENIATVAPIPSNYRRAEALWNILSDNGLKVGVMNWWATWPAEPVNGYIYTDRALFNKMQVLTNYRDKEGGSISDIYPPELITELQRFASTPEEMSREDLERFVNVESEAFWREFNQLDTYDYLDIAYEASMFKFSFPGDKTVIEAAKYLLDTKSQPDFWAIYLQGMDSMSHQYLKYYFWQENQGKLIPVNLQRYKDLIENYYTYIDEAVGAFLSRLAPNTIVFVVSDHGFDEMMLPTGHYHHVQPSYPGESEEFHINYEKHPGIFIASGPGIKRGEFIDSVTVLDIAPTILTVMGFPLALDMDGRPLENIFESPPLSKTIATYDRPKAYDDNIMETKVDKEMRDKLKALGYIK